MLTYEDVTEWFIKAAANLGLIAHPEEAAKGPKIAARAPSRFPGVPWILLFHLKGPPAFATSSMKKRMIALTCIHMAFHHW